MKVLLIAGARPNFMKIVPIYREALKHNQVQCKIVHTGQHYDYEMSEAFFEDLELPKPDFFLSAGSGSHAVQTAKIMVAFEELCQNQRPVQNAAEMRWQGGAENLEDIAEKDILDRIYKISKILFCHKDTPVRSSGPTGQAEERNL
jgi:hypothetical protein